MDVQEAFANLNSERSGIHEKLASSPSMAIDSTKRFASLDSGPESEHLTPRQGSDEFLKKSKSSLRP